MSDSAQSNKLCLALKWVKLNTETMQPNTRHENKKKTFNPGASGTNISVVHESLSYLCSNKSYMMFHQQALTETCDLIKKCYLTKLANLDELSFFVAESVTKAAFTDIQFPQILEILQFEMKSLAGDDVVQICFGSSLTFYIQPLQRSSFILIYSCGQKF